MNWRIGPLSAFALRCWVVVAFFKATALPAATVSVLPDADSFLRSLGPTNNYGAGGALSVSGSAVVNGSGFQNGLFDSLLRFPMSNVVATLDTALGTNNWVVTGSRLTVTEMAASDNAIFNRGVGAFEVRWLTTDDWLEGTGKPVTPTQDGVAWLEVPTLLNPGADKSLGIFTNAGADVRIGFDLKIPDAFVSDVRSTGEMTLYLTAASPEVGFTFNSRNFGNTNAQPVLEMTAEPNPRPTIERVTSDSGSIQVTFTVTTNWAYRLQRSLELGGAAEWSDVLSIPPQPGPTNMVYDEGLTNARAFYRLSASAP